NHTDTTEIYTLSLHDALPISRATGARIVNNLDELSASDLGFAKLVEERRVETEKWVFVEECKNPKSVSILVRGGSQRVVDEAERDRKSTRLNSSHVKISYAVF